MNGQIFKEERFVGDNFAMEIIAKGSFVDDATGDGGVYMVETTAVRLNHVALNAWILSEMMNVRECYESDEEFESHKAKYAARRKAIEERIVNALGYDMSNGGVIITQSYAEMFTVVRICKIKGEGHGI